MKRRFVAVLLSVAALAAVDVPMRPAYAQDWKVEGGEERQREIIKRYKKLLERTPTEGLAFKKLLDYVGTGKGLERLVQEYRKKVENKPDAVNYRLILGHLLKATNEYDKALEHYEKAVELAPDNPVAWLSRGSVHELLQHPKEASADYEKALSLETNRDKKQDILRKLADAAFAQREWDKAQTYYDQLVELDPRNEYLRMEYAQVLIQYKRYDKALAQYEKLLELAGRDAKARATTMRDMGDLYEKMGQDDKAIETYRKAMRQVRATNWLHRELRQRVVGVYRRTDRLHELVEQYEKQWRSPDYDQSMTLASLYDELGREDEALKYFRRASAKSRRSVDPRLRIIRILERKGEDKAVIKEYQRLISVAPREHRYQFDLVRLHFRLGDRKAAERMLDRIERRFSRDPDVHVMLADMYMRFDLKEKAHKMYQKLVRMDPKSDAYILGLGEYYYQNAELDKAVKTWMKLLDSSLEEAEAHARLGQVLAEHGLVEKGLQYFEKAVEIAPDDLNVRRGLALAYERARRWDKAVESWTYLLERAEQPLTANEARSRIINIYRRQNKLRAKMREFAKRFEKKTPDIQAGFFLAEAHLKVAEYQEAEAVLQKIVAHARAQEGEEFQEIEVSSLLQLEKLYQQNSDLEQAIVVLQRLAELMPPRSKEYYHRIAELSLKLYEDDQAVRYATMAVEMNPDDALAQARLGDVYYKMGKLESAAAQYRQAIDLDPRAFEIALKLAGILLEIGQFEEAEEHYRTITKKANDENLIHQAARRALSLAEAGGKLEELETEFFPLVYRTPPKPIYRKIVLELYDRLSTPLTARDRYGVASQREEASRRLDEIGQRALPVLVDALSSDDVSQRATAVRLLGDFRQGNAALALSRMVDDPEEPLRMLAGIAVAQTGDARGAAPLVRVTQDSDPGMRALAIWALGATGGEEAVKRLTAILVEGQSWREQALAAISLGRVGTPEAVRALESFYGQISDTGHSDFLTVAVVWGLGRSGSPQVVDALGDALASRTERVAAVAAWGLAQVRNEQALRRLLDGYWSQNSAVRQRAGRGLVQFAAGTAQTQAQRERRRVDEVRREARLVDDREGRVDIESIVGSLENAAAIVVPTDPASFLESHRDVVVEVARGKLAQAQTRELVLRDLISIQGRLGFGVLTNAASRSEAAEQTLAQIVRALHEPLREIAGDKKGGTAAARALSLLGHIGDRGDVELVVRRLESKDDEVRRHAALALGGFAQQDVRRPLTAALEDSSFEVRAAAARAMGRTAASSGDRRSAVNALVPLLADDYPSVQIAAAEALGVVASPDAVEALTRALIDTPIQVKVAALQALQKIDSPQAKQVVDRFRRHPDLRLRQIVAPR